MRVWPLRWPAVPDTAFVQERLREVAAVGLSALGVWCGATLLSYRPNDPGIFVASAIDVHNWGGRFGASFADVLYQSIGLAACGVPLVLLAWTVQLLRRRRGTIHALRLAAVPPLLCALAAVCSGLLHKGGVLGMWLLIAPRWLAGVLALPLAHTSLYGVLVWTAALVPLLGYCLNVPLLPKISLPTALHKQALQWWRNRYAAPVAVPAAIAKKPRTPVLNIEETAPLLSSIPTDAAKLPVATKKRAEPARPIAECVGELPPIDLLQAPPPPKKDPLLSEEALNANADDLQTVLQDFGVRGVIKDRLPGPVITLYEMEPAPGTRSARVISLADDIARAMSVLSARVAVVPGKNAIGVELPNVRRETVYLREIISHEVYKNEGLELPMALGKDISGRPVAVDLTRMPHLLIAGTTGSGKSVGINTMILSLLYRLTPQQCKMIMIDPKMLELSVYDGIPHLLSPVVVNPKKAVAALKWAVREMEERYALMSRMGVRKLSAFNDRIAEAAANGERLTRIRMLGFDPVTGEPIEEEEPIALQKLPYIVIIIDEMADLMMVAGKDIEGVVQRLAQMARAAGIHLIMATQRPSVDVITGTIKANFPTRISFQVTSKIDSRTILGEQGAEQLLGQGDMLLMESGGRTRRVHGAFVSDREVEDIVAALKATGAPQYVDNITVDIDEEPAAPVAANEGDDPMFNEAVNIVRTEGKSSVSYLQRRLKIGYNRAARLVEEMENRGLISKPDHTGKREVMAGAD